MDVAKSSPSPSALGPRIHKSCESCKARKVRCPNANYPGPCGNCIRRNTVCQFRARKVPRRDVTKHLRSNKLPEPTQTPNEGGDTVQQPPSSVPCCIESRSPSTAEIGRLEGVDFLPKLYVDHLLAQTERAADGRNVADDTVGLVKGNGIFGESYSLTFFSDSRLLSLSTRLQNSKVNELVRRINTVVSGRVRRTEPAQETIIQSNPSTDVHIDGDFAASYIKHYFAHTHGLYPFLDRASFEERASSPDLRRSLARNKAWCSLYYSILAIGCLHGDGGSFEPGKGEAWRLFSVALSNFSELLILPDSLITLQALTAMAIYGLNVSCLSIERVVLSEASRRAQGLASTNLVGQAAHTYQKTFWVLYGIEKVMSFHFGRGSAFVDSDISCQIPRVPEAVFGGVDWFMALLRHARVLSRTYTALFSVGASCNASNYCLATIDQLRSEMEQWRLSIPESSGLRPGSKLHNRTYSSTTERSVALSMSYLYHSFVLILSRAKVHHLAQLKIPAHAGQQTESQAAILESARAIIELTTIVDVEPYTPLWILAVIPLSALFVLFDIIVHNPGSPDTASNLALLDMGAGYFSRIEYASGNTLPGSLIAEFAHIARDYVNDFHRQWQGSADDDPLRLMPTPVLPSTSRLGEAGNANVAVSAAQQPDNGLQLPNGETGLTDMGLAAGSRDDFGIGYSTDPPGTDIMGLFSYFLPDVDSLLYQNFGDELDSG